MNKILLNKKFHDREKWPRSNAPAIAGGRKIESLYCQIAEISLLLVVLIFRSDRIVADAIAKISWTFRTIAATLRAGLDHAATILTVIARLTAFGAGVID
jgi:hypothetical protein